MTIKLAIVVITIYIMLNFGRRVDSGMVNFNSRVRVRGCCSLANRTSRPVTVPSSFVIRVTRMGKISRIRQFYGGRNILGASGSFGNVILRKIKPRFSATFLTKRLRRNILPIFSSSITSGRVIVSHELTSRLRLQMKSGVCTCFFRGAMHIHHFAIINVCYARLARFSRTLIFASVCAYGGLGK